MKNHPSIFENPESNRQLGAGRSDGDGDGASQPGDAMRGAAVEEIEECTDRTVSQSVAF